MLPREKCCIVCRRYVAPCAKPTHCCVACLEELAATSVQSSADLQTLLFEAAFTCATCSVCGVRRCGLTLSVCREHATPSPEAANGRRVFTRYGGGAVTYAAKEAPRTERYCRKCAVPETACRCLNELARPRRRRPPRVTLLLRGVK